CVGVLVAETFDFERIAHLQVLQAVESDIVRALQVAQDRVAQRVVDCAGAVDDEISLQLQHASTTQHAGDVGERASVLGGTDVLHGPKLRAIPAITESFLDDPLPVMTIGGGGASPYVKQMFALVVRTVEQRLELLTGPAAFRPIERLTLPLVLD